MSQRQTNSGSDTDLTRLLDLVARLRAPDGCPWDREQTLPDLRAYLIEEAHETAAAIDAGDWQEIGAELGDLLFQAVFVCRLGEEAGALTTGQVLQAVHDKMVARHPHVFGDETLEDSAAVRSAWELRKLEAKGEGASLLAGVPTSLPSLTAAYRISQKAAGVGFDWPTVEGVVEAIEQELDEVKEALALAQVGTEGSEPGEADGRKEAVREEIGDLLFSVANLARKMEIDPEAALAGTNAKFRRRFGSVERGLAERGRPFGEATLEEMEALWQEAKRRGE